MTRDAANARALLVIPVQTGTPTPVPRQNLHGRPPTGSVGAIPCGRLPQRRPLLPLPPSARPLHKCLATLYRPPIFRWTKMRIGVIRSALSGQLGFMQRSRLRGKIEMGVFTRIAPPCATPRTATAQSNRIRRNAPCRGGSHVGASLVGAWRGRGQNAYLTGLDSIPIPSISTSVTSPGLSDGGAPEVPVKSMSPGSSVTYRLMNEIASATP